MDANMTNTLARTPSSKSKIVRRFEVGEGVGEVKDDRSDSEYRDMVSLGGEDLKYYEHH